MSEEISLEKIRIADEESALSDRISSLNQQIQDESRIKILYQVKQIELIVQGNS